MRSANRRPSRGGQLKRALARNLTLGLVIAALLTGCGSRGDGATGSAQGGSAPTSFVVPFSKTMSRGVLHLGRPGIAESVGATVEARYPDGTLAAVTQT